MSIATSRLFNAGMKPALIYGFIHAVVVVLILVSPQRAFAQG